MDFLNITNVDYEGAIKEAVKSVKENYGNLTTERTCRFYSNLLINELRQRHLIARIINTKENLDLPFDHSFVLVKDNLNFYTIDLTYSQFFSQVNEKFNSLVEYGYIKMDDDLFKDYILSFTGHTPKVKQDKLI